MMLEVSSDPCFREKRRLVAIKAEIESLQREEVRLRETIGRLEALLYVSSPCMTP